MLKTLSGQILRTGGSGQFIALPDAQPALGPTPSTSTGYTLITTPTGITRYSNVLGNITFFEGSLTNNVLDQNITIQTSGTGILHVFSPTVFENTVTIQNFSFTDLTVSGLVRFTNTATATSITSGTLVVAGGVGIGENIFVGANAEIGSSLSVGGEGYFGQNLRTDGSLQVANSFTAGGTVTLDPRGYSISIQPSDTGTVTVYPRIVTGSIDNMNIGTLARGTGKFTDIEAFSEILTSTATSYNTTTGALIVAGGVGIGQNLNVGSSATIFGSLHADNVYDNNNRVITQVTAGQGLGGGGTGGPNVTLSNTGVLSIIAGTNTNVSSTTGNVTVWITPPTLQYVTQQGNTTDRSIFFNNSSNVTGYNTASVVVLGGQAITKDLWVGGNVRAGIVTATTAILNSLTIATTSSWLGISTITNNSIYTPGGVGIGTDLTVVGNTLMYGNLTVLGTQTLITSLTVDLGRKVIALSTSAGPAILSIGAGMTIGPINNPFVKFLFDGVNAWQSTGNLNPATNKGYNLGSAANQWNTLYTSRVSVSGTDTALTSATGALTVAGGVGIGGRLNVGNQTTFQGLVRQTNNTESTSTVTGATVIAGGLGVGGNIFATQYYLPGGVRLASINDLSVFGVAGVYAGTDTAVSSSSGLLTVWNTSTLQSITSRGNTTDQAIYINNVTNSFNSTTGALTVAGGVSIQKDLYVGGNTIVYGTVTFSGTATNVLTTNTVFTDNLLELHKPNAGSVWTVNDGKDIGVRFHYYSTTGTSAALVLANDTKYLEWYDVGVENPNSTFTGTYGTFKTGSIKLVDGTDSINTVSGALTIVGGAGIGGNLWVGGSLFASGSTVVTTATLATYGVTSITAGTDTAVSSSTGLVVVWNTSNLQTVTDRGNSTNNPVTVNNTLTVAQSVNASSLSVTNSAVFHKGLTAETTSTFNTTVVVGSSALETSVTSINTADPTSIDSFDTTLYRSARCVVQISDVTNGFYQLVEVVLMHDDYGQVYKSEYGIINTGIPLGEFTTSLIGTTVSLYFTAFNASNITSNVVKTLISV